MPVLPPLALLVLMDPAPTGDTLARIIDPPFTDVVDDQVLARASASMAQPHLSMVAIAARDTHTPGEHVILNGEAFGDSSTIIDVPSRRAGLPDYPVTLIKTGLLQYEHTVLSDGGVASVSISLQVGALQFRGLSSGAAL